MPWIVRKTNLFYTHEMTHQKWPYLLMCRDLIFEGFFHTLGRPPRPTRGPRAIAAKECSGYLSERVPTRAFVRGRGRHLQPFPNSATREDRSGSHWRCPADRNQTAGLEKRAEIAGRKDPPVPPLIGPVSDLGPIPRAYFWGIFEGSIFIALQ